MIINMLPISVLLRTKTARSCVFLQVKKFLSTVHSSSSGSDSSDDEGDNKKSQKIRNEDAANRLNILLQSMMKEEYTSTSSELGKQLAKPKGKINKEQEITNVEIISPQIDMDQALTDAAKKVAENLGGDVKQTESELLNKLLSHSEQSTNAACKEEAPKSSLNLSELIVGMKIDRTPKVSDPVEQSRAQQVRMILQSQQGRREKEMPYEHRFLKDRKQDHQRQKVHISIAELFEGKPLGIFRPVDATAALPATPTELGTWKQLEERELRLAITHPPSNIFEEMIVWTEQGKIWQFPINNEQGLEKESSVYFAEHVFLEPLLEPWCPRRGPIRHFMELVCVGLSKNPYVSVQDKRDHIAWFQQYFEQKQDILKEVGALDNESAPTKQEKIGA